MEVIGRYRVRRRIGAGAFSTVWLGNDDELDVPVAVKVIAENWLDHADVCGRFLDEARLLRRITDPRVIGVYDIGRLPDGRAFFVMDYADRGTVQDLCTHPVPAAEALLRGAEIADAVEVLHRHGVIHRDLKPANLLLSSGPHGDGDGDTDGAGDADGGVADARVVIADLGMAKRLAEASGLTMAVGTPGFMAPEQAHGQLPLDRRADVYSTAAVVYALLTGRRPFADESGIGDVATRPLHRTAPPVAGELGLPPAVDTILRAALAGDPEERPATAATLAAQLRELHAELAKASNSVTTAAPARGSGTLLLPEPGRDEPTPPANTVNPPANTLNPPANPLPSPSQSPSLPQSQNQPQSQSQPQSRMSGGKLAAAAVGLMAVLAVTTWLGLSLLFHG
ncbi:serine/threonine protein kinase [Streptomyces sp. NA04227]|uniref:serine/threonine-protein kinase n=1 Tax=Streptomyces sp. NA04227 TaxID=2742136 RepID=UPI0015919CFB|nr:serine/threonine-protein kinase [Streptomyces sp. NA04227]QKW07410.1 serine/threonine protein kinase [Streptomyces sp. NA04227]